MEIPIAITPIATTDTFNPPNSVVIVFNSSLSAAIAEADKTAKLAAAAAVFMCFMIFMMFSFRIG